MKMFIKTIVVFVSTVVLFTTVVSASATSTYTTTVKSDTWYFNFDMCTITNIFAEETFEDEYKVYFVDKNTTINIKDYCEQNYSTFVPGIKSMDEYSSILHLTGREANAVFSYPKGEVKLDKEGCYFFYLTGWSMPKNLIRPEYDQVKFYVIVLSDQQKYVPAEILYAKKNDYTISVNHNPVKINAYNVNGSLYVTLSEVANKLSGTSNKFNILYGENSVELAIKTKTDYINVRNLEYSDSFGSRSSCFYNKGLGIDDKLVYFRVFNIGCITFYKLRDLSDYIGFSIEWDATKKEISLTTK